MTMDSLRDFVRALDEAGELVRVREPVSTVKEITEVADRCMKSVAGGPSGPGQGRVTPRPGPGGSPKPQPRPLRAPVPPRPQPHPVRRPAPNRRGR